MYLKELTLRGFKSFASTTRFQFEPGITAIVGPNGSGKSNVVDALAWVMGEQGAKSLRGANMADVIFAGGTSRSALGRAQVELTIDNSDGRLPISYSEVTISRTMFRSGGSEYAINRQPVRLLDVQELLSDSGLGRQMHVIVGQGQLDRVLSASPMDRRAFIDEAAGVAKHRRRKERALRKLESMDANLVRVLDLTEDMSARLRPLARQAKAARAARGVRASLAYASARVLADDLSRAEDRLGKEKQVLERLRRDSAATQQNIDALNEASQHTSDAQTSMRSLADQVGDRYRDFTEQQGRFTSIKDLANERAAGASRTPVAISESAVALAQDRAQEARTEAVAAEEAATAAQKSYEEATAARASAEPRLKEAERALAERQRSLRLEREQYEKSLRDLESGRLSLQAVTGQAASARERLAGAQERLRLATEGVERHLSASGVVAADGEEPAEGALYEDAAEAERAARDELTRAQREERASIEEHSRLRSRRETLQSSLRSRPKNDDARVSADVGALGGKLGTLEDNVRIERGWEEAINALLGTMLSALVIEGPSRYQEIADQLVEVASAEEIGAGGLILLGDEAVTTVATTEHTGENPVFADLGCKPALSVVHAPAALSRPLASLLAGAYVCADVEAACLALARIRDEDVARNFVVATTGGAVFGAGFTRLRGAMESSRLLLKADLEETERDEVAAGEVLAAQTARVKEASSALKEASLVRQEALGRLRAADAQRAKVAQETARLKALAHAAAIDVERVESQVSQAEEKTREAQARVSALESALPEREPPGDEILSPLQKQVDEARAVVQGTWEAQNQARMDAHIAKERAQAAQKSARAFETQAQSLRDDRTRQLERERAARSAVSRFYDVAERAEQAGIRAQNAAQQALELRDKCRAELQVLTDSLVKLSADLRNAEAMRAAMAEELLQSEVAFASAATAVATLRDKALDLTKEYGELLDLKLPLPPGLKRYDGGVDAADAGAADLAASAERDAQEGLWDEALEAADNLLAAYGPHLPWDPPSTETEGAQGEGEPREAEPRKGEPREYVREYAQSQMESSQRALSRLGVVNPLAIEEYDAASARFRFLQDQVQDLNRSKADLLDLIKQVDIQVRQAFEDAFTDTSRQFESTFSKLFPGGTGRLELTDPSDPLTTGVEIYARPFGKRVTRLSLLSGGERSLAALAYLIAIFEARPSPFYILDEIEAALDDINLSRVLGLLEDLRKESQLLIITHQKRTMEFADALYGVTMKDGVTAVMSHRMAG